MKNYPRLDSTDWKLLRALQEDGRLRFSALARQVGLTAPAVAERVRRLEDAGVIRGYHADVDPTRLGYPITAVIRLALPSGARCAGFLAALEEVAEVVEAHRVTGTESGVLRAVVGSSEHLEDLIDRLTALGNPTTGIATSSFRRVPAIAEPASAVFEGRNE